MSANRRELQQA